MSSDDNDNHDDVDDNDDDDDDNDDDDNDGNDVFCFSFNRVQSFQSFNVSPTSEKLQENKNP